jgi:hypothetical protein
MWPKLEIPPGVLDSDKWLGKISRRLARAEKTARVRIARQLVRQITTQTTRIRELETELTGLVTSYAPELLAERGCGALTAAKLIGGLPSVRTYMSSTNSGSTCSPSSIAGMISAI